MDPLTIKGALPNLNEEIRLVKGHWANYSKTKKAYTNLISAAAKRYKNTHSTLYPIPHRLHISLHWFVKNKRKDPDNIYFAVKYVLDGMVKAGLLDGDGYKHISSISHSIEVSKEERVEVRWYDAENHQVIILPNIQTKD